MSPDFLGPMKRNIYYLIHSDLILNVDGEGECLTDWLTSTDQVFSASARVFVRGEAVLLDASNNGYKKATFSLLGHGKGRGGWGPGALTCTVPDHKTKMLSKYMSYGKAGLVGRVVFYPSAESTISSIKTINITPYSRPSAIN